MNRKRGLSDVITTVLIILLALAAIVIVWQVVKSLVSEKAGEIDVDILTVQLSIEPGSVFIDYATSNLAQFSVTRGADNVNFSIVRIILANKTNTLSYTNSTPDALGTKIYKLDITKLKKLTKISVYPVSRKGKLGIPAVYEVKGTELPVPPGGLIPGPPIPPDCTSSCEAEGKGCGQTDICGTPCTACPIAGQTCNLATGVCGACVPACGVKVCGPDNCGNPNGCGTCPTGQTCNSATGTCCAPNCAGKTCGTSDGCGGICTLCPTCTCPAGETCKDGVCGSVVSCAYSDWTGACRDDWWGQINMPQTRFLISGGSTCTEATSRVVINYSCKKYIPGDSIIGCGQIYQPGTYTLTGDIIQKDEGLITVDGNCLLITADNVVLDLNGKKVIGLNKNYNGVIISTGRRNVMIKNAGIIKEFNNGIYLENSENITVEYNKNITSNYMGIGIYGGRNNTIRTSNFSGNTGYGVYLASQINTISNVSACGNIQKDLYCVQPGGIGNRGKGNYFTWIQACADPSPPWPIGIIDYYSCPV